MRNVTILLAVVAMLALTVPAGAAVRTWDGDGGADTEWTQVLNWSGDARADSDDLTVGSAYSPTSTVDVTSSGGGSITLDGAAANFNTVRLSVGSYSDGDVTIQNSGTLLTDKAYVGIGSGTSTVTITGSGSQWTTGGVGAVAGTLDVNYTGSTGVINVLAGGNLSVVQGAVFMSRYAGNATINVDGLGSTWTNSSGVSVVVGRAFGAGAVGTVNITDQGVVSGGTWVLGNSSGGTGTVNVTGTGAQLNVTETGPSYSSGLKIGGSGDGTLNITAGGTAQSAGNTCLGEWFGGTGAMTVSGAGSTFTNASGGTLYVGGIYYMGSGPGSGTLTISDGGTVIANAVGTSTWVGPGAKYGDYSGGSGEATISGASTWTNVGALKVGGATGTWGPATGKVTIVGGDPVSITAASYVQSANGTLELQLDGDADPIQLIALSGNITLDGDLVITGTSGAVGPVTIMTYGGSLTGTFATVTSGWTVDYGSTTPGSVTIIPEPATLVLLGIGGIGVLIRRRRK